MTGIIYKWTNLITNKSYIGKSFAPQCRYDWFLNFDEHYAGPHIDRARRKYNDKIFWEYSILFQIESDNRETINDIINQKEIEYINLYQSNNKELGYNISSGGTWGDTFAALTEEERRDRMTKFHNSHILKGYRWMHKDDKFTKISLEKQQEYINNGWQYGKKERPPKEKKQRKRGYKLSEEHKQHMKEARSKMSLENKEKLKNAGRQNIILYNKSEKHRQSAIQSNKARWKDGCPESTRKKISDSHKGIAKGLIWMSKDNTSKMIKPSEYQKYIDAGWHKGRK